MVRWWYQPSRTRSKFRRSSSVAVAQTQTQTHTRAREPGNHGSRATASSAAAPWCASVGYFGRRVCLPCSAPSYDCAAQSVLGQPLDVAPRSLARCARYRCRCRRGASSARPAALGARNAASEFRGEEGNNVSLSLSRRVLSTTSRPNASAVQRVARRWSDRGASSSRHGSHGRERQCGVRRAGPGGAGPCGRTRRSLADPISATARPKELAPELRLRARPHPSARPALPSRAAHRVTRVRAPRGPAAPRTRQRGRSVGYVPQLSEVLRIRSTRSGTR